MKLVKQLVASLAVVILLGSVVTGLTACDDDDTTTTTGDGDGDGD